MLSLEECRKLLGPDCPEKDSDLELLRSSVFGFAEIVVDEFLKQQTLRKETP